MAQSSVMHALLAPIRKARVPFSAHFVLQAVSLPQPIRPLVKIAQVANLPRIMGFPLALPALRAQRVSAKPAQLAVRFARLSLIHWHNVPFALIATLVHT
jgi:hypothetical protein